MPHQTERNIAEDNIIKDIRNLFRLEKKKEKSIKDKVLRYIRTLLESNEEDYYKPVKIGNALMIIMLNIKIMEIKIKPFQLKNTLIRSGHI